jgi:hypothetical protein
MSDTANITPRDILNEAARVFAAHDRVTAELRALEAELQILCRSFGEATRRWGYAPHHLRLAVEAQVGKIAA